MKNVRRSTGCLPCSSRMLEHPDFEKYDFSHTAYRHHGWFTLSHQSDGAGGGKDEHAGNHNLLMARQRPPRQRTMTTTDDSIELRVSTVGRVDAHMWRRRLSIPETGETLGPGQAPGEFCARGYNIMKGYYKMEEATAPGDRQRWLAALWRPCNCGRKRVL